MIQINEIRNLGSELNIKDKDKDNPLQHNKDDNPPRLHPVILVPGDGGSQIEARLNRTSTGHWWCSKTSDW